ncbi:MAG: hypothetical protein KDK70_23170 [Myxococcales bacterium]|nr:hypothetical protein [Myxococcales bacterium]
MRIASLISLPLLGALGSGCGPSLDAEWVQWFSHRVITDVAATPEGDAVVVGTTMGDERVTASPFGQSTGRPWSARVSSDGALEDLWTGYVGSVRAVAVDDQGRTYLALWGVRDDEDWSTPERCELRALAADGSTLWTEAWNATASCPEGLWIAAGAVIMHADGVIGAYEPDGRLRWQLEVPPTDILAPSVSAHGDRVWLAFEMSLDGTTLPRAWRIDARDGTYDELELSLDGLLLGEIEATADGLLVMGSPRLGTTTFSADGVLVSLTPDGRRRWSDQEPRPEPGSGTLPGWDIVSKQVVADGHAPWVLGTERLFEEQDSGGQRHRILLQRWTADGELSSTVRRSFVEAHHDQPMQASPEELERAECPTSDAGQPPQFGSRPEAGAALPDGSLLVAGRQGCRDSFLMRLEVQQ